jgi:hypothetical protein
MVMMEEVVVMVVMVRISRSSRRDGESRNGDEGGDQSFHS